METIKVENVKEAIEEVYELKRRVGYTEGGWDIKQIEAKKQAYNECLTILENLIVRRQRNELRQSDKAR